MVRFFRNILSKIFKKSNCNVSVTVTKFVIKRVVYIKEKNPTSEPSKQE